MDIQTLSEFSDSLIEQLLSTKFSDRQLEIGITRHDSMTTADLTWNEYDTDQILSLRYHRDGHFDLFYHYYDDEQEGYISLVHDLDVEQTCRLPEGLATVMAKALIDDRPLSINDRQLSSSQ